MIPPSGPIGKTEDLAHRTGKIHQTAEASTPPSSVKSAGPTIRIKVNTTTKMESFYPLYDNGRSLFYQDNENTIQQAYKNPRMYCTTFGAVGSYYDHIEDIFASEPCAISLIDLTVTEDEVYKIMKNAGFNGYKLEGIVNWVSSGIGCLKELSMNQNNTEDIKYADNDGLNMI